MLSGSKGLIRSMAGRTDFANSFGKAHFGDVSHLGENKAGRKVPGPYLRCPHAVICRSGPRNLLPLSIQWGMAHPS
jgi:hypothetical protein